MKLVKRARQLRRKAARGLKFGLADELGWLRWARATRGGRQLPRYLRQQTASGGLDYSQSAFETYRPLARTRWPMLLLGAIPNHVQNEHGRATGGKLLIIGPRFESELLLAEGLGWPAENVSAIDLLAYSPRVTVGDMHSMPFPDEHFDSIVCGWTLSYSKEPATAAQEIDRVCAPGGVVCFGVEVADPNGVSALDIPDGDNRIQSVDAFSMLLPQYSVIAHFAPAGVGNLIVAMQKPRHSEPEVNHTRTSSLDATQGSAS